MLPYLSVILISDLSDERGPGRTRPQVARYKITSTVCLSQFLKVPFVLQVERAKVVRSAISGLQVGGLLGELV